MTILCSEAAPVHTSLTSLLSHQAPSIATATGWPTMKLNARREEEGEFYMKSLPSNEDFIYK